ncbi:MAG: M48 family metallopeptidase [Bacteroidota bacterium]
MKASYTDGKSGIEYAADIQLQPSEILISFYDAADGRLKTLHWHISFIRKFRPGRRGSVMLANAAFPSASLEFTGRENEKLLSHTYPNQAFATPELVKSTFNIPSNTNLVIAGVLLWCAGFLVFFYLFVGDLMVAAISRETETNVTKSLVETITTGNNVDTAASAKLQAFGNAILPDSARPRLYVINDDIVNAFALPGNTIVVYKGILDKITDYRQLAALLGHEYGHILHRHPLRGLSRHLAMTIIVGWLVPGDMGMANNMAPEMENMRSSRSMEEEADITALGILMHKGISARGMAELFEMLKKETDAEGGEPSVFVSTHPDLHTRIETAKESMKHNPSEKAGPEFENLYRSLMNTVQENNEDTSEDQSPESPNPTDTVSVDSASQNGSK